ncbi:hypothetical protein GGP85_002890 [Salinibacter ruber]|nr:hypothetical protein [Salinibacter ruber]
MALFSKVRDVLWVKSKLTRKRGCFFDPAFDFPLGREGSEFAIWAMIAAKCRGGAYSPLGPSIVLLGWKLCGRGAIVFGRQLRLDRARPVLPFALFTDAEGDLDEVPLANRLPVHVHWGRVGVEARDEIREARDTIFTRGRIIPAMWWFTTMPITALWTAAFVVVHFVLPDSLVGVSGVIFRFLAPGRV